MSSQFAQDFNENCRPALHALHGETVVLQKNANGTVSDESNLTGVWARVNYKDTDEDGIGLQTYTGMATFTVLVADLPGPPGAMYEIKRLDEVWVIRHMERQDEWTWKLWLSKPDAEIRMPERVRF